MIHKPAFFEVRYIIFFLFFIVLVPQRIPVVNKYPHPGALESRVFG